MFKASQDFNFIYKRLDSFICFEEMCFRKCFDSKSFFCFQFFHFKHSGKLTLAQSPYSFELVVKTKLIDQHTEFFNPGQKQGSIITKERVSLNIFLFAQTKPYFFGLYIFLNNLQNYLIL